MHVITSLMLLLMAMRLTVSTCYIIRNYLTDDDDDAMMRQRRQLYAQGNVISRGSHMRSVELKKMLFITFCTPMNVNMPVMMELQCTECAS